MILSVALTLLSVTSMAFRRFDSSFRHFDGSFRRFGSSFHHSDDSIRHFGTSFRHSDDSIRHSDGSFRRSDSSFRHSADSIRRFDSSFRHSDSSIFNIKYAQENKNYLQLVKIALCFTYFFNFAKTFSISSSSVNAATGRLFTKVNVFLRPGPQ
ncbi:hypothetical protein [Lysinibacillus xylanilyticus]|uniref:hypothetical protein n=1 Tax=Lysinibacillus xylanilyticus TaxID=582475 RepID=UPI003D030FBA